jgi:predicted permease
METNKAIPLIAATIIIFMIGAFIFSMFMLDKCKKDGYSTIACMSMMQNGSYLIVSAEKGNQKNVDPR